MKKFFIGPILLSLVVLAASYALGGKEAFLLVAFLSLLEISLSFDNAVINAKILAGMNAKWRQRFLTWGMLIAVLGTRLVFPALLVALAAGISPLRVVLLALYNPVEYAQLVQGAEPIIYSFGGAFLLMVALKYFFDEAKQVHWIRFAEKYFVVWGKIAAVEVGITLLALGVAAYAAPAHPLLIMGAGAIGVITFILMEGIINVLDVSALQVGKGGLVLFLYLNLLDAVFSLDGVIGAFALTTQLLVIVAGLGLGAYFVRAFTLVLVKQGTLDTLVYLEHGAYWAIAALAFCMFASLTTTVPEAVAGSVSILFLGAAYLSSLRERRKML